MPSGSGSHGGGGGSHFSGGSSGGGFGGSGSHRPVRPMVFISHGRHYYVPAGTAGAIRNGISTAICLTFFILFCILPFVFMVNNLNYIESERARYIEMIDNALKNSAYIREGEITDAKFNEDINKWYFEYKIELENTQGYLEGYSFALYDDNQIKEYYKGRKLNFAIDTETVLSTTDSIDLGYKDIPLEQDGEYANTKLGMRIIVIVVTVLLVITVIDIIATVRKFKANKKEADEEGLRQRMHNFVEANGNDNIGDVFSEYSNGGAKSERRCPYCGSVIKEGKTKCGNCGAEL